MAESTAVTAQEQAKKPKILVADDSKLVRITATKILSEKFDLVLAEDGEDAWQKICADETIQVVFTDLGMPNLDGYGLIQRMRQSENEGIRNQPVIVITGAAEEEDVRRKVFELGATDFITKPFKSTEIVARAEAHASYRRDKESLQKNVDIDLLTNTLNRSGFNKQLKKDVSFINRHGESLALVTFELDGFKEIYERVGEQASNKIIKQIATTLTNAIRKEDSVGRYGLDRFTVILPMAKTEGVVVLAQRLCEIIKSFKVTVGGETLPISMSAGIASQRKGTKATGKDLLDAAEKALHNAQKLGPGEIQLLKLETQHAEDIDLTLSIDYILEAIDKGATTDLESQMDKIVARLMPLMGFMSDKQKLRLIKKQ